MSVMLYCKTDVLIIPEQLQFALGLYRADTLDRLRCTCEDSLY